MAEENKPAQAKRTKISRAQQLTMLEVLGASLILGVCLVLVVFLVKYIGFNTEVISAKNEAITDYDQSLRNIGICQDTDKNGRLNGAELDNCDPYKVAVSEMKDSLRFNVLNVMANNQDLESVARQREQDCYDANGEKIDFMAKYEETDNELAKQQYLLLTKVCSALRVVPDALPAQQNTEALMASLNQIFILSNWEPETLSPRDDVVYSAIDGVGVIPVTLRVEGSYATTLGTLNNIERSIREFDITSGLFEWTTAGISLQAQANAYYLDEVDELEITKTVNASRKGRK